MFAARTAPTLTGGFAAIMPPKNLGAALVPRQHSREYEQQVRQPVQIFHHLRANRLHARQRQHPSLCTARNRTRHVTSRRRRAATRQMNSFNGGSSSLKLSRTLSNRSTCSALMT